MPTLTIGDKSVTVGDDFLKLSRDQQNATVDEIAKSLGASAPTAPATEEPISANNVVRAVARGVPGGGILNKMDAATNAVLAPAIEPFMSKGPDSINDEPGANVIERLGNRYRKSLNILDTKDKNFAEQNPVTNTAAELTGGVASLGGVAKAVPAAATAMGFTGLLRTAIPLGATTGGAIGAVDAASRGEDMGKGFLTGAVTGGVGPAVGKGVGKVWDKVAGAWREAPAAVPTRTVPVAGVDVPARESVLTGDPHTSAIEQADISGGNGPRAQAEARAGMAATDEAMGKAHENLATSMAPAGAGAPASPLAAGEAVSSEVASQEAARAAAEAQRLQGIGNETEAIRGAVNTSPTPGVLADSPRTAAEAIQQHLIAARDAVAGARDRAYEALRGVQGYFEPAGFSNIGRSIRQRLNAGPDPVKISDQLTPHASAALEDLDLNVGQRRFENQTEPPMRIGPDGRPIERQITADTIDEARKRLISMQRAANDAARKSGDMSDVRAVRRVISAFDDHVTELARNGGFNGNANELLSRMQDARGLHAQLKRTFGPANPQDKTGKAIEAIVGKRGVDPVDAETVKGHLFGSETNPGGPAQAGVAGRVIDMFGENSPQHALLKQGLLSHLADAAPGMEARSHAQVADRMSRFFHPNSPSASLAGRVFGLNERARILNHANRMRVAADPVPAGFVEKTIAKWSGREGGLRASPKTIVDDLIGSTGTKGTSPMLVDHLRSRLSPAAFGKLKQGVWSRITEAADGKIPWQDQKVGNRIAEFVNGDGKGLADALFTKAERDAMLEISRAHIANLPIEGTKPLGSGPVIQRLTHAATHSFLPFVGLHVGGLPGAAVALAANAGVKRIAQRAAGKAARERFYGPQPKRAPSTSTLPQTFGALGGAALSNQSR